MGSKRSLGAAAAGLVAAAAIAASGCGWSARDTHMANQKVTVQPRAGDGSGRFSRLPEDPFRAQRGMTAVDVNGR